MYFHPRGLIKLENLVKACLQIFKLSSCVVTHTHTHTHKKVKMQPNSITSFESAIMYSLYTDKLILATEHNEYDARKT